ncbi:hypothetical protein AVEN_98389-1 [Araneus ventricosus]|uniref:Uncharacterized protein n=1 Tax=Araneus ventricosus TaxID=182803 RepID=A0A4Y2KKL0_ARAVE|nr:hypothetical protein AVEN_98389-1 [Araneus ventricosus]
MNLDIPQLTLTEKSPETDHHRENLGRFGMFFFFLDNYFMVTITNGMDSQIDGRVRENRCRCYTSTAYRLLRNILDVIEGHGDVTKYHFYKI